MAGIQNGSKIQYKGYIEALDVWITYRIDLVTKRVEVWNISDWTESDLSFDTIMSMVREGELFSC